MAMRAAGPSLILTDHGYVTDYRWCKKEPERGGLRGAPMTGSLQVSFLIRQDASYREESLEVAVEAASFHGMGVLLCSYPPEPEAR